MVTRLKWPTSQKRYVGRKYRGRRDRRQVTLTVVDVTFGGDLIIHRRGWGRQTWDQDTWNEYLETAKEIEQ